MAYVTGTANSLSDLLTAIQTACTANGWTLAGNVLYKGTCYVEIKTFAGTNPGISLQGGTGKDGSNALTGRADALAASIGSAATGSNSTLPTGAVSFTFPVTYDIHINTSPDEVYVAVNYANSYWQHLMFGQSQQPGLSGTGNWFGGSSQASSNTFTQVQFVDFSGPNAGQMATGPFLHNISDGTRSQWGVHHALDGAGWQNQGAGLDWTSLFFRSPNTWNGESVLFPIRVYASRPSGFVSPVLECAHARFVNLGNVSDQQIITLGSDRWKVYPWWIRGTPYVLSGGVAPAGGKGSGLGGYAARYDGP